MSKSIEAEKYGMNCNRIPCIPQQRQIKKVWCEVHTMLSAMFMWRMNTPSLTHIYMYITYTN